MEFDHVFESDNDALATLASAGGPSSVSGVPTSFLPAPTTPTASAAVQRAMQLQCAFDLPTLEDQPPSFSSSSSVPLLSPRGVTTPTGAPLEFSLAPIAEAFSAPPPPLPPLYDDDDRDFCLLLEELVPAKGEAEQQGASREAEGAGGLGQDAFLPPSPSCAAGETTASGKGSKKECVAGGCLLTPVPLQHWSFFAAAAVSQGSSASGGAAAAGESSTSSVPSTSPTAQSPCSSVCEPSPPVVPVTPPKRTAPPRKRALSVVTPAAAAESGDEDSGCPGSPESDAGCGGEGGSKKRKVSASRLPPQAVELLKNWLVERLDQPYPSKEEKADLALRTGLGVAQVNNWFINARRRFVRPLIASRGPADDPVPLQTPSPAPVVLPVSLPTASSLLGTTPSATLRA